jgi:ABC-type spermidine/putrescine transport system permease subunit I
MASLEATAGIEGRRRPRIGNWGLFGPTLAWALFFIILPFLLFFIYSFWGVENEFIVRHYSLTNYIRFFSTRLYPILLWNSIQIAFGVSALTFILGYPLALFISRQRGRAKAVISSSARMDSRDNVPWGRAAREGRDSVRQPA